MLTSLLQLKTLVHTTRITLLKTGKYQYEYINANIHTSTSTVIHTDANSGLNVSISHK